MGLNGWFGVFYCPQPLLCIMILIPYTPISRRARFRLLLTAATAVPRRPAAQADPLGYLETEYSPEDHGGRPVPYYFFHISIT